MDGELASWISWALQAVVIGGLTSVLSQQRDNTKAITELRVLLAEKYATRLEVHKVSDDLHTHQLRRDAHGAKTS